MEQLHAEMALQRREDPNHGRQGGVEGVRGRGQAALLDDPHKRFHRPELVHDGIITSFYGVVDCIWLYLFSQRKLR
jgi:hypothetical protein